MKTIGEITINEHVDYCQQQSECLFCGLNFVCVGSPYFGGEDGSLDKALAAPADTLLKKDK